MMISKQKYCSKEEAILLDGKCARYIGHRTARVTITILGVKSKDFWHSRVCNVAWRPEDKRLPQHNKHWE